MGDRNKSGLEQRLSKIEKRLRRVECCAIMPPASNASGLQYGLLHFTVGDSGKLIIFSPYSETVQAAPAAISTTYLNAIIDPVNYTYLVRLSGQGFLIEGVDYSISAGQLDRLGGFRFEGGEIYELSIYNK